MKKKGSKKMLAKIKEAITKGRVYQCRFCGKNITMKKDDGCQHDFLLVEIKKKENIQNDNCTCPTPDVLTARQDEHKEICKECGKEVKEDDIEELKHEW